jgi:hypothetical protein
MFLFSATFYPIETYPPAIQTIVTGRRSIRAWTCASLPSVHRPEHLIHVRISRHGLAGLASSSRRLDKLLLK